ncbi:MAG: hypothetical protein KKA62_03910 [Nanoarchaeota archaeon]|nr:hypothetical protein [Nanoarchaeota archaeon]MBU1644665.1 hypothetical protein [Nanoarchaeota archaeon]MBU1977070.1 hypothetical protein [Nanoarchaeota archaeon]
MNVHFKNYLDSFSFKKRFWQIFAVDTATLFILTALWMTLGNLLTARAFAISGGKSIEELKAVMLSGSLNANEALLASIKSFVYIFTIGIIIATILTFIIFSLSRMIIWEKILKNKFSWKSFSKWNGLAVLVFFISLLYLLIFSLARMIFNLSTLSLGENTYLTLLQFLNYFFFLAFLIFVFVLFYSFTEVGKVWQSVSHASHIIKTRWSRLWKQFLLIYLTGLIVGFFISYLQRFFFQYPDWVYPVINLGLLLLYISWLRLYLLKAISLGHEQGHQRQQPYEHQQLHH